MDHLPPELLDALFRYYTIGVQPPNQRIQQMTHLLLREDGDMFEKISKRATNYLYPFTFTDELIIEDTPLFWRVFQYWFEKMNRTTAFIVNVNLNQSQMNIFHNLNALYLENMDASQIHHLNLFKNLRFLDLFQVSNLNLDLTECTLLDRLVINNCENLAQIPTVNPKNKIETLQISKTLLYNILDLSNFANLTELNLRQIRFNQPLNLTHMKKLEILICFQLADMTDPPDTRGLTQLTKIHIIETRMTEPPILIDSKKLVDVDLGNNRLIHAPILPDSVERLYLSDNRLTDYESIQIPISIKYLVISNNPFDPKLPPKDERHRIFKLDDSVTIW